MTPPLLLWYPLEDCTLVYTYGDPEVPGPAVAERVFRRAREQGGEWLGEMEETIRSERGAQRAVIELRVSAEEVQEGPTVILRAPTAAGTAWTDGPDDWRIDAVGVAVTVPAGTFHQCLRVVYTNEDIGGGVLWLAQGIGMVKHERYGERGPFLYELQTVKLPS